jgi:hypothetical protein
MIDDSKRLASVFMGKEIAEDITEEIPEEGIILFKNLKKASIVIINGEDRTKEISNKELKVDAGKYDIVVTTPGMADYSKSVSIKSGEKKKFTIKYIALSDGKTDWKKPVLIKGYILLGTGVAMMTAGTLFGIDGITGSVTTTYNEYVLVKHLSLGNLLGGITTAAAGGVMLYASYSPDNTKAVDKIRLLGMISGGTGIVLTLSGIIFGLDDVAGNMTNTYEDYVHIKGFTSGAIIGGAYTIVTGSTLFLTTLLENDQLTGIVEMGTGAGLALLGIIFGMDDVAGNITGSYNAYATVKGLATGAFAGGLFTMVMGGSLFITNLIAPQIPQTGNSIKPAPLSLHFDVSHGVGCQILYSY